MSDGAATATASVSVTVDPVADIAVFKSGQTNATIGTNTTFTITVSNLGPATASNVVVMDQLPDGYAFVTAVPTNVTVVNGLVSWPAINLAGGQTATFNLTALPITAGLQTNKAFATSVTYDPNSTNNDGSSTNSQVTILVTPPIIAPPTQFSTNLGQVKLNRATSLYEQNVTVVNNGPALSAVRLCVGGLPGGVQLFNRAGVDATNGLPYVQYNPLSPMTNGASVIFALEYLDPTLTFYSYTNQLYFVVKVTSAVTNTVSSSGSVPILGKWMDNRYNPARFLIEFNTLPNRTYTIIYSDDGMNTWRAAVPSITAASFLTQWYDDGPPKTVSRPVTGSPTRFYQVILNP
jgi:uncharacterized repeat protein (TIGR01451 family)